VVDVHELRRLIAARMGAGAGSDPDVVVEVGRGPVFGASHRHQLPGVRVGDQPGPGRVRVEDPLAEYLHRKVTIARQVGQVVVQPQQGKEVHVDVDVGLEGAAVSCEQALGEDVGAELVGGAGFVDLAQGPGRVGE